MNNSDFFNRDVSERFQRAVTKLTLENYRQASRFCYRNFAEPQAKDLSGVFRRARIEEDFAGIPALFKSVTVSVRPYENNTGFYNELTCGAVKLTQSCISEPSDVPRFAKFRKTLAQNGQLGLFKAADEFDPSRFLYAILTHGVDTNSERRSWPAFVRIQFPDETCTKYVDEGIDLLSRFPELRAEYVPTATVMLRLRQRARKKAQRA